MPNSLIIIKFMEHYYLEAEPDGTITRVTEPPELAVAALAERSPEFLRLANPRVVACPDDPLTLWDLGLMAGQPQIVRLVGRTFIVPCLGAAAHLWWERGLAPLDNDPTVATAADGRKEKANDVRH